MRPLRDALELDRQRRSDLLFEIDAAEVDVEDVLRQVVVLHVLEEYRLLLIAELEVVPPGVMLQTRHQLFEINGDGDRFLLVAVNDGREEAFFAQPSGFPGAELRARLRINKTDICHVGSNPALKTKKSSFRKSCLRWLT